jgi:hypothetical protein
LPDMGLEIPVALLYVAQFRKDALAHCKFQITIENTANCEKQADIWNIPALSGERQKRGG